MAEQTRERKPMSTTTTTARKPLRLGQRLLGSGILDLLAGPAGVD